MYKFVEVAKNTIYNIINTIVGVELWSNSTHRSIFHNLLTYLLKKAVYFMFGTKGFND